MVKKAVIATVLFVGLVCIWVSGCETQEQKLIKQLQDQNQNIVVRINAAEALGKIGSEEAVPALIQALQNEDEPVRGRAAEALGQMGEGAKDAVPALLQVALQDEIHFEAIGALGDIGSADAVTALIKILQDKKGGSSILAAETLGRIGTPEAIKAAVAVMIQTYEDPEASASDASDAEQILIRIGTPEALIPFYYKKLQDEDPDVRGYAAEALGQMGEGAKDAVPALTQALQDEDPEVIYSAIEALESIGTPEALKASRSFSYSLKLKKVEEYLSRQ